MTSPRVCSIDTTSFATRAILGEEDWTRNPTSDLRAFALGGLATASLAGAMVASYHHRMIPAVAGTGICITLTLGPWTLWAGRFAHDAAGPPVGRTPSPAVILPPAAQRPQRSWAMSWKRA
ncbi:hypothetical protein GCM10027061_30020 [Nesterenkonia suensis]